MLAMLAAAATAAWAIQSSLRSVEKELSEKITAAREKAALFEGATGAQLEQLGTQQQELGKQQQELLQLMREKK